MKIIVIGMIMIMGCLVGASIKNVQPTILDLHKNKIEMQLAKYKQAQDICGKNNVEEVFEYVKARQEETGEYTCANFYYAARTPEERLSDEEEKRLENEWDKYKYQGGTMNFSDWSEYQK